uniref:Uncharacterized protein n=1 Tax=Kalanchoe fedtschenkoi TaxID=63787 RepID=A0A7N0U264_KALFE
MAGLVWWRCSLIAKKPEESMRLVITAFVGIVFGFLIGLSLPNKVATFPPQRIFPNANHANSTVAAREPPANCSSAAVEQSGSTPSHNSTDKSKIWVPTNPRGAERLPPAFVESESDFYLRRLWGVPSEDLKIKPKYLVTFTVGFDQKANIDAAVKKFSDDFQILLFHYDGRPSEWDDLEWSKKAVHVSARKQSKWWFAKRFLHPDIVAAYDYVFIWDEDLGLENFNGEEYLKLVKKHGLEISQPGAETRAGSKLTWKLTRRRNDTEVHKSSDEPRWNCKGLQPPCAGFVEIMAPVFSREAWRCVWHMIQNDLVHGWGLDFALGQCVQPAHEKIGVVDAQWIIHQGLPSLGNQGEQIEGKAPWQAVRDRCMSEWKTFRERLEKAKKTWRT